MAKLDDPQTKCRVIESEAVGFERMILRLCPDCGERKLALQALRQALAYAKSSIRKKHDHTSNDAARSFRVA